MRLNRFILALILIAYFPKGAIAETLVISRFPGLKKDGLSLINLYTKSNGHWKPFHSSMVGSMKFARASNCVSVITKSLFQVEQSYAMNRYIQDQYLTKEEVARYLKNSVDFSDRPVSFYHLVGDDSAASRVGSLIEESSFETVHFQVGAEAGTQVEEILKKGNHVHASLYSVSGQKIKFVPEKGIVEMEFMPLPWTQDPEFSEAAKYLFDRKKYNLVWELGRAASAKPGDFSQLLSAATLNMAQEALHLGVPNLKAFDHAYVTFHSLSKSNTEKYIGMFSKESVFVRSQKDPDHAIFLVPLKKMLERFPVQNHFLEYAELNKNLSKVATVPQQMAFVETMKYVQHREIEIVQMGKKNLGSVTLSSAATGFPMVSPEAVAESVGIPHQSLSVFKKANTEGWLKTRVDAPLVDHLKDLLAPHMLNQLEKENAFQIGNLDPLLAATDIDYVPSMLVGAFDHYAASFLPKDRHDPKLFQQFIEHLNKEKINFMVTTNYPSTAGVIKRWGPAREYTVDLTHDVHSKTVWRELEEQSNGRWKRPSKQMKVFVFTPEQMMKLRPIAYRKYSQDMSKAPGGVSVYGWWLQGVTQ